MFFRLRSYRARSCQIGFYIYLNQPFRESALDELEQREGAGTLFVQPIIT